MVRVSGVPYDVLLDPPAVVGRVELSHDEVIATLEQENRLMRARMDRLEDELRAAEELIFRLNTQLLSLQEKGHYAARID